MTEAHRPLEASARIGKATLDNQIYKALFEDTNDGQLLDINVFRTNANDWQTLLDSLPGLYACRYLQDGAEFPLPTYSTIREVGQVATVLLSIDIDGMKVNTHFFATEDIQFDILPKEVSTADKGDRIIRFMQIVSRLLDKDVYLNEEDRGASEELLKEHALGLVESAGNAFRLSR